MPFIQGGGRVHTRSSIDAWVGTVLLAAGHAFGGPFGNGPPSASQVLTWSWCPATRLSVAEHRGLMGYRDSLGFFGAMWKVHSGVSMR